MYCFRYSRYEKNREARLGGKDEGGSRGKEEGAASLIDLDDDPLPSNSTAQITSQLSALGHSLLSFDIVFFIIF
jgi:hypothetical protein